MRAPDGREQPCVAHHDPFHTGTEGTSHEEAEARWVEAALYERACCTCENYKRVVTSRKHLTDVRQSSRRAHIRRVVSANPSSLLVKNTRVAKPPLPRPACPSPIFTVLFLEANWGWPRRRQLVRNSFCFWSQHGLVSCAGGPCATSVSQAPVPRKSTATLRKSTAHRRSFSRPFRV